MTSCGFIASAAHWVSLSVHPGTKLTQHGQLNAWLASLLIVLNQEMWGIKMQQFMHAQWGPFCQTVGWSRAEKASYAVHTHLQRNCVGKSQLTPAGLYVRWSHIQFTWALAHDLVLDTVLVHCEITTARSSDLQSNAFSGHSFLVQLMDHRPRVIFFFFFLHLKAGWEACKSGSPCTSLIFNIGY